MRARTDWMHRPKIIRPLRVPGFRGVLQLGRYNQTVAHAALDDHRHDGALEVCLLLRGRQTYVVGDHRYEMRGGDVFVTFPGEVHSTGRRPQEKGVLYWLIVALSGGGLPGPGGAALAEALRRLPRRHFPGDRRMQEHCDAIMRLELGPPSRLRAAQVWHHVEGLLLQVVERARCDDAGRRPATLEPVLDYIAQRLDQPIRLAELARRSGFSLPRFKALFKAEQGVPPGEYVLRARVARAERLLRESDLPVTEIALRLGFSSSQYFATVVRRFTRLTPSAVRAAARRRR